MPTVSKMKAASPHNTTERADFRRDLTGAGELATRTVLIG
jgi:hypothetical protein